VWKKNKTIKDYLPSFAHPRYCHEPIIWPGVSAPVQDGIGPEEVVVETEDDVVEVALLVDIIVEIEDDVD
jgi:hypothetical protein